MGREEGRRGGELIQWQPTKTTSEYVTSLWHLLRGRRVALLRGGRVALLRGRRVALLRGRRVALLRGRRVARRHGVCLHLNRLHSSITDEPRANEHREGPAGGSAL